MWSPVSCLAEQARLTERVPFSQDEVWQDESSRQEGEYVDKTGRKRRLSSKAMAGDGSDNPTTARAKELLAAAEAAHTAQAAQDHDTEML